MDGIKSSVLNLMICFASVGLFPLSTMASVPPPSFGKIVEVVGKAWTIQGTKKTPIQSGSALQAGDVLVTEGNAEVKLVLGDREAALLVKKDSQLNIQKTAPRSWTIDLDQGMLLSYVKPLPGSLKAHFRVKTPVAVMGVRGTIFFVKFEPKKDLFLCTCSGMVSVDDKVLIIGKHHDSPKFILSGDQPISKRLQATTKGDDHTDAEAVALEKLINL